MRTVVGTLAVLVGLAVTGYVAEARTRGVEVGAFRRAPAAPGQAYVGGERTDHLTDPDDVPASGSGRFVTAAGGSPPVGTGRLYRYHVLVEDGSGEPPEEFAAAVERILADRRGWVAGRRWGFRRVSTGPSDLSVHLATPATTDRLCDSYGVNTNGDVSCRGGRNVVINLKRWRLAVPWYSDALEEYRQMVVNHEVGHFLGYGHMDCPRVGAPAPVMQRQTFGLQNCARNPWPYPDGTTFVAGPPASR